MKTDLAAIRFFHDKMSRPKYTLPTNSELGVELERRRFGQLDRTWSGPEFNRLLGKAMAENRDDFILALYLGRYAGFVFMSASALTQRRRSRHCGKTPSP